MSRITSTTFTNARLISMIFLGFSSGLPLALTASTLQAWFTQANVNLVAIGALSLIGIPYTLKFLWAPLMDQYGISRLGKRRSWILAAQLGLAATLFILAQMNPSSQASLMGMMALVIAFFSASQDVAVDAYRTEVLAPEERGLGSAYYIFAYRVALLLSGGFALICADYLGWKLTYEIMAVLILLSMLPAYKAPAVVDLTMPTRNVFQGIAAALKDLLQHEKIILILLFIVLYKAGDALALSLMTNFMLHGLGFTLTEVGLAYKVVSFIATVLGAFVGGIFLVRWSVYRALLWFGFAQAFSNLMFVVLALVGKQFTLMAASIFIENFCSGLSTAALMAFMMSLCNRRYTAGQYAMLSAIASLGRVFLGPLAALMVESLGWVQFFSWAFVLSFPGVLVLLLLKERVVSYAPVIAD